MEGVFKMTDILDFDKSKFNKNFNINLSGKQYIDYLKYEANKPRADLRRLKEITYNLRYFAYATVVAIGGMLIMDKLFPTKYVTKDFGVTLIGVFPIPNLLIYVLAFMIGLAWVFHGFGFIIVRR